MAEEFEVLRSSMFNIQVCTSIETEQEIKSRIDAYNFQILSDAGIDHTPLSAKDISTGVGHNPARCSEKPVTHKHWSFEY